MTGSSSGLREAIAKFLAAEGVDLVVHGRRGAHRGREILASGGNADTALGDVATDEGADAVARAATAGGQVGQMDILVNNAGFYRHVSWSDALPAEWNDAYNINIV